MGIYTRFKRGKDGLRALVELLESTPMSRRQKMIDAGMKEDPDFTYDALQYVMTFEDILKMNDLELAEVLAKIPPKVLAYAMTGLDEKQVKRFLTNMPVQTAAEVKASLGMKVGPTEIAAAQIKVIGAARELEKKGVLQVKKIPL